MTLRSQLLHPLESRDVHITELPLYPSDGPGAFHVMAVAPSGAKLYLLHIAEEITIGFGEHWHCHIHVDALAKALKMVEAFVSGSTVIVEWFAVTGKYTGSGPVPLADVPGSRRLGDRFAVVSWSGQAGAPSSRQL